MRPTLSLLPLLAHLVASQFPPQPTNVKVVTSKLDSNVTIAYKQHTICETTKNVRSFAGYIDLPQSVLSDMSVTFDIHTFFLYFEARNNPSTAPLLIYLAGGPGESSTYIAFSSEGGPCYVNPDQISTTLNPWSMNNHANVLYIDQPAGAGLSYTSLMNGTINLATNAITPLEAYNGSVPDSNIVVAQGTFSDPAIWATTNTTQSSAQALWHFAEHWLTQFPEYKSSNRNISIWGNSYGGLWTPTTATLFDKKLKASTSDSALREWAVDNIGITNGLIDFEKDVRFYAPYAFNNTYQPIISEQQYLAAEDSLTKQDGCLDQVRQCRETAAQDDPTGTGVPEKANTACQTAIIACIDNLLIVPSLANKTAFDIAVNQIDIGGTKIDPCSYYLPVHYYLNQGPILQALGARLNFTYISQAALNAFSLGNIQPSGTGDSIRVNGSEAITYLLSNNISVALVYGDRDSRTPWIGAEDFARNIEYPKHKAYAKAGFENITTNAAYTGGVVRQYDGFSFSRVFQAGHMVHAYQPETMDRILSRTLLKKDIATGNKTARNGDGYATNGEADGFVKLPLPDEKETGTCIVAGAFQKENVWVPFYEAVQALAGGGGEGNGTATGMPNATETNKPSAAGRLQIGRVMVGVPLVVAVLWGLGGV
ncbi:alpha/beta-hydrolase [Amniculicola lignicola CBS 123094]|uniref:Alpha/beta-hydrolase n=1 Tax=Amniculicola lignicola CBS 123094 TaxID=1392246 RepID=A0A6A5X0M9_9PLEO|nr:alpha/beta-hydrolase [Amniculicola lignicola CBS 123094]